MKARQCATVNFSECADFPLKMRPYDGGSAKIVFPPEWMCNPSVECSSHAGRAFCACPAPLSAWNYGVAVKFTVTGVPEVPVAFLPLNGVATSVWLPAAGLHGLYDPLLSPATEYGTTFSVRINVPSSLKVTLATPETGSARTLKLLLEL